MTGAAAPFLDVDLALAEVVVIVEEILEVEETLVAELEAAGVNAAVAVGEDVLEAAEAVRIG